MYGLTDLHGPSIVDLRRHLLGSRVCGDSRTDVYRCITGSRDDPNRDRGYESVDELLHGK